MEDTLRDNVNLEAAYNDCLNPCFNGRYSQSMKKELSDISTIVLILVLMEDTLREQVSNKNAKDILVLILVLMEDTLRDGSKSVKGLKVKS